MLFNHIGDYSLCAKTLLTRNLQIHHIIQTYEYVYIRCTGMKWALKYKCVDREHLLRTSLNFLFVWLVWHVSSIFNIHQVIEQTSYFFIVLKMSNFLPESNNLRKTLIFCFHLKKSAAESHRKLVEAYADHALSCNVQKMVSMVQR